MDLFQKREVFKDQIMMPPNEPLVRPFILQINSVPKHLWTQLCNHVGRTVIKK